MKFEILPICIIDIQDYSITIFNIPIKEKFIIVQVQNFFDFVMFNLVSIFVTDRKFKLESCMTRRKYQVAILCDCFHLI